MNENPKKNPLHRRRRMSVGLFVGGQFTTNVALKRAAEKPKRPRLNGTISKLPPFDVTAFAKQAHEANQKKDAPKRGAFGTGAGLSGLPPKLRAKRRQNHHIAMVEKRAAMLAATTR